MFANLFIVASALVVGITATPVNVQSQARELDARGFSPSVSFNHWGGYSSLDNFDNFYGVGNFDGSHYSQVFEQDHEVVCHSEQVVIIQQRLAVIRELAKRIITEQICDVQTQTVVFEQFHSGLGAFKGDLRHISGHKVGYDSAIAGHYGSLFEGDGSFTTNDLGFSGQDIGAHTVLVSGSNWDDATSFSSVNDIYGAARHAFYLSNGFNN